MPRRAHNNRGQTTIIFCYPIVSHTFGTSQNNRGLSPIMYKKDERGRCMTQCDRELAEGVRFGYNSGTSIGKSTAIYLWMRFNTFPDPGENDSSCKDCEPKK
jgi:hypothetical protein